MLREAEHARMPKNDAQPVRSLRPRRGLHPGREPDRCGYRAARQVTRRRVHHPEGVDVVRQA